MIIKLIFLNSFLTDFRHRLKRYWDLHYFVSKLLLNRIKTVPGTNIYYKFTDALSVKHVRISIKKKLSSYYIYTYAIGKSLV